MTFDFYCISELKNLLKIVEKDSLIKMWLDEVTVPLLSHPTLNTTLDTVQ